VSYSSDAAFMTLGAMLASRAAAHGDRTAFAFVRGDGTAAEMTYGGLHRSSLQVAALLGAEGARTGDRVLIAVPPGPDYVTAFLGCQYAGCVAVPAYPPRGSRHDDRLAAVAADAAPSLAFGSPEAVRRGHLPALRWLTVGDAAALSGLCEPVPTKGSDLAFLQYTSGSTGAPKGVMVPHRAVLASLDMISTNFGVGEEDVGVSWLPAYHDMGLVGGVLTPIYAGIKCVLLTPAMFAQDPGSWLAAISRYGGTVSGGPDFGYRLCAARIRAPDAGRFDLSRWRLAFTGAEPIRMDTLRRFAEHFAGAGFRARAWHPCYGLAEATLIVAGASLGEPVALRERDGDAPLVASGRPLCPVRITDPDTGEHLPSGTPGEIWASGPAVADGYWRRPDDTARTFGPWLRTGDLGVLVDGQLFVTGRAKDLVIVRGRKIHPHDVEERVGAAHPLLRDATAVAFGTLDAGAEGLGVAVEVDRHADAATLREALAAARGAVVESTGVDPSALVAVRRAGLPRTSSGKVRRAETARRHLAGTLPTVPISSTVDAGEPEAVDEPLRRLWRLVAARLPGAVPVDVPLTRLGLDSLGAAQLVAAGRLEGLALDLELLLAGASLAELARAAAAAGVVEGTEAEGTETEVDLRRAFWLHEQVAPDTPASTMAAAVALAADVDPVRLDAALRAVLARHPVLRSRFGPGGTVVYDPVPPRFLDIVEEVEATRLAEHLTRLCEPAPQLAAGNLVRASLVPVHGGPPVLHLVAHHAVADARSLRLLLDRLDEAYDGVDAPQEPPPVVRVRQLPDDREWWRERLAGLGDRPAFPADRPAPSNESFRGATVRHRLRCDGSALASSCAVTRFTVLLAAAAVLVARYTGDEDVVVGVPFSARDTSTVDAIGYLVLVLPVRVDLAGARSVRDVVRRTRDALAATMSRATRPLDELAALSGAGRRPLFDVAVVDDGDAGPTVPPGRVFQHMVPVDRGGAAFPLSLVLTGDELAVEYAVDRFDARTARSLAGRLDGLLAAMVAEPDALWTTLPLRSADEPPPVSVAALPTTAAGLLHEAVWASADRTPDAVAVRDERGGWTYRRLRVEAARVTCALAARGIGRGDLVGLLMPRSNNLVAAMLGVLEAGAAYVPLDPAYPSGRNEAILADAGVATVLTGPPEELDVPPPARHEVRPHDVAYVCYTSGSTGTPKGAVVEHRQVVASTAARLSFYTEPVRGFLLLSSPAFDSSVAGIYWTLASGGTLIQAPAGTERDPVAAWRLLAGSGATHTLTLPSLWAAMLDAGRAGEPPTDLCTVVVAGEECHPDVVRRHLEALPRCSLVNEYGPTETTVWATAHVVSTTTVDGHVPIGRPVPGMVCHVLDRWGNEAPAGVPGELYLGGPQLVRGYHRRPEETARRFVDDARRGRLYRTGDRVSWHAGGTLRYHGRVDGQLKVRGHRVEPGEVEAVLSTHPAVAECAVVAHEARLVGYLVPRPGEEQDPTALREWLAGRLPSAFVPTFIRWVPALPRTPNGKLDRRALPPPRVADGHEPARPPSGRWEEMVAQAYAAALECGEVGADDDFFDLGGHSLAAAQVAARLTALTGTDVGVREVLDAPTVRALAERLAHARDPLAPIRRQPRRAA
jgi:amino acid adenylation domain-containing protein